MLSSSEVRVELPRHMRYVDDHERKRMHFAALTAPVASSFR